MKRSVLFAMLALTLSAPAAFAAQGEWVGGGQFGAHMPTGDYGDFAKTGWLGGVFIDYMATPVISLGANLDYHSTKAEDALANAALADDINVTIFNYGLNGAFHFPTTGAARPYLKVAGGMYNEKTEVKGGPFDGTDDTSTDFGIAGGGGIMFRPATSSVGFGVEALYHNVFGALEDVTTGDKKDAQIFTVAAKLTFSFSDMSQQ